jgi:hypothetical protein
MTHFVFCNGNISEVEVLLYIKIHNLQAITRDSNVCYMNRLMKIFYTGHALLWENIKKSKQEHMYDSAIFVFPLQFLVWIHVRGTTAVTDTASTYCSCYPLQVIEKVLYWITLKERKQMLLWTCSNWMASANTKEGMGNFMVILL